MGKSVFCSSKYFTTVIQLFWSFLENMEIFVYVGCFLKTLVVVVSNQLLLYG